VESIDSLSVQDHHATVLDLAHAGKELLSIGRPHPDTGKMAARALTLTLQLAMDGKADGGVYPPLCKDTLDVGDGRHGDELELLRSVTNAPQMARIAKIGNVLRTSVTGHIPFRDVADMVTTDSVLAAIEVLQEAASSYGTEKPRIAVAALNPHGGESGQIGREEIDAIGPAVEAARSQGIDTYGPLPADTVYVRALRGEFDGVVNMYHDQGNIAAKVAGFGEGVVLYTRSPVIVATVAHGMAFDIAGKGVADPANLRQVIEEVAALAKRRMGA
jgi:4-hydroxythreonine-4-phosphate dehydrogenase